MITQINCPACNELVDVECWFDRFVRTTNGLYYFKCDHCKVKLGSTLMPDGKLAIWEKSKEEK